MWIESRGQPPRHIGDVESIYDIDFVFFFTFHIVLEGRGGDVFQLMNEQLIQEKGRKLH